MNNFYRVVRLALQHRLTLAMSLFCALGVAVLWGANIGVVYPFVEVVFKGESLQDWSRHKIDEAEQVIVEKTAEVEQFQKDLATASDKQRRKIESEIIQAESRIKAERKAITWYRWLQPYIDQYLPTTPFATLALIISFLLLGTLLKDLFLIGNNIMVARLAQLSTFELRNLFYRRTLRMDLASFNRDGTADLMSRFTHDMKSVNDGVVILFGKLIREPLKMASCLIGAALICWRLLFLSMILAPVAALLIRWLSKTLKRANRRAMEEMAEMYTTLEETFSGIKVVKAFTNEPHERNRFYTRSKKYYKKAMRIARYDSLSHPMSEVLGIVAICLALLAGAHLVLSNETHVLGMKMTSRPLDLGMLLIFYGLLAGVADPVRKFADVFNRLQSAAAASDRVYERLDRDPTVRSPLKPVNLSRHHKELVFDGVDFAYQPDDPILKNINLQIPFGQTVAIVGPNGCGKSTLANLIPRFYDPTQGTVKIDGIPLTDVRLRQLRHQISLVTQEVVLFDDTVFENIRYGRPNASREQVIAAAKQAHAHEFIENELSEGYETMVGPWGSRLSGGQRQRISLARAILRDPSILILDEATSQVDLASEQAIQSVLEEFIRGRTAVIITHRLPILKLADQIIVMQSGEILDKGTHDELLGRCQLYRRLHQLGFEVPPADAA